ncbi:MAG: 50S ribosomal protein L6 [Patescibacteria group bacterium]|nr:50S ribosomal protein L6 [Patescibacteria group bacterium]MDE1988374.1 50S ribosomal protein L6 [Patescibacteria group bacterium]MDE2218082.1 50S ribosomal protein L6 [Patescibacteria group bacterium]
MSRIGKKIIEIAPKTEVAFSDGILSVKGPLGELSRIFKPEIKIEIAGGKITLNPKRNSLDVLALWGTYASHIINMIAGVHKPFEKKLIVEGIGYKSDVKGEELVMSLGFSHPVKIKIPKGLKVTAEKNVIAVSGIDNEKVGQFVAKIRDMKKPEPYKGKGIRYEDEVVRRKEGKKSV